MKIIIDIDEGIAQGIIDGENDAPRTIVRDFQATIADAIKNSTPLPEQQPCEDCISRQKLLSRIDAERKHLLEIKMDGAEHIIVHHARRIIEDMPSVTPSIPDVENNYNIGYNCGYTDAMIDIAESEDME